MEICRKLGKFISMALLLAVLLPGFVVVVLFTFRRWKPSRELLKTELPEF